MKFYTVFVHSSKIVCKFHCMFDGEVLTEKRMLLIIELLVLCSYNYINTCNCMISGNLYL